MYTLFAVAGPSYKNSLQNLIQGRGGLEMPKYKSIAQLKGN